jgi:hypothetical protein
MVEAGSLAAGAKQPPEKHFQRLRRGAAPEMRPDAVWREGRATPLYSAPSHPFFNILFPSPSHSPLDETQPIILNEKSNNENSESCAGKIGLEDLYDVQRPSKATLAAFGGIL